LEELSAGGSAAANGRMIGCEAFPAQPPHPLRVPIGHFAWGFTAIVTVGAGAGDTTATISNAHYRWHAGGAGVEYRALMAANYPDWMP